MINKDNIVFCSATAWDRIDQAYVLFKSIKEIYPNSTCYFHGIGCSNEQLDRIMKIGVNVTNYVTSNLPEPFDIEKLRELEQWHLKEKGYIAYTDIGLLSASWRLHMLPKVMKETGMPVMWLDSDCIVRKNLDSFFERASEHDLSVHYRPKNPDHSKILSSVFVVNTTEKGNKYADLLCPVYKELYYEDKWWADPHTLGEALIRSKVDYWNFKAQHYNDSALTDSAYIWHAKHSGVDKPKWKKEFNRILES